VGVNGNRSPIGAANTAAIEGEAGVVSARAVVEKPFSTIAAWGGSAFEHKAPITGGRGIVKTDLAGMNVTRRSAFDCPRCRASCGRAVQKQKGAIVARDSSDDKVLREP